MPLKVFLSGVSSEFEDVRIRLADHLTRLGIDAIRQDILPEPGLLTCGTVGKLIRSVSGADMVVCLIGKSPGYPGGLKQRKTIVDLAKDELRRENSIDDPGDLWKVWCAQGHGMTYTQLELLLVASAFWRRDRRQRLFVYLIDDSENDSIPSHQLAFLRTIRDHRDFLIWGKFADQWESRVLVDILAFSQSRYGTDYLLSSGVKTNEALRRSLEIANIDLKEQRLSRSSYASFYHVVQHRMADTVNILEDQSASQDIENRIPGAGVVGIINERELTIVLRTSSALRLMTFDLDTLVPLRSELLRNSKDCYPFSLEPGGNSLLAFKTGRPYLFKNGEPPLEVSIEYAPDSFSSGLPRMIRDKSGEVHIRIPDDELWKTIKQDGSTVTRKCPDDISQSESPAPIILLFQTASTRNLAESEERSISLRVSHPTVFLPCPHERTTLTCIAGSTMPESLVLRRYSTIPILQIFECDYLNVENGGMLSLSIEKTPKGELYCIINHNGEKDPNSETRLKLATNYPAKIPDNWNERRKGDSSKSGKDTAFLIKGPLSEMEQVEFPYKCKYCWFKKENFGEFLITIEHNTDADGFAAKAYRFPSPTSLVSEFIPRLEKRIGCDTQWDREKWQAFLQSL